MSNDHSNHQQRTDRILAWLEGFAPLGLILTAAAALAQEGYFQFKYWFSNFTNLPDGERWYVALSIAVIMAGLRLWFLVMSSKDVAAGNRPGYVIGVLASLATLVYTIWECTEIAHRWAGQDAGATIVMFVFTTVVVVAAEIRIMLSRFGSWRSSATKAAEALEEARKRVAEAEAVAEEVERNSGSAAELIAGLRAELEANRKEAAEAAEEAERKFRNLLAEAEAAAERSRNFQQEQERKFRDKEAEATDLRKRAEAAEAEARNRIPEPALTGRLNGHYSGTPVNWPERLAEAFRNLKEQTGRVPTHKEVAEAAGTSDKTERNYREKYQQLINS